MISVIISIYKNLKNLEFIFQGLQRQSYKNFEVVVSEDNEAQVTVDFLNKARGKYSFLIKHVSQEDIGFRKTRILNKAVSVSAGDYLVFLDGDCVPHKHLLKSYSKFLAPNTVCMGKRCMLTKEMTEQIYAKGHFFAFSMLHLMLGSKNKEYGLYLPFKKPKQSNRLILGCNYALDKKLLLAVNGFDEDYQKAGVGEDHDLDWRLRKHGARFLYLSNAVVVYHLYHESNYDVEAIVEVNKLLAQKLQQGKEVCNHGIAMFEHTDSEISKREGQLKPIKDGLTDLQKRILDTAMYKVDDMNLRKLLIKILPILRFQYKHGIDPCKPMIAVELTDCTQSTEEILISIKKALLQSPNAQIVLLGDGEEKVTDMAREIQNAPLSAVNLVNKYPFSDKVAFIAHSVCAICCGEEAKQIADFMETPNF